MAAPAQRRSLRRHPKPFREATQARRQPDEKDGYRPSPNGPVRGQWVQGCLHYSSFRSRVMGASMLTPAVAVQSTSLATVLDAFRRGDFERVLALVAAGTPSAEAMLL